MCVVSCIKHLAAFCIESLLGSTPPQPKTLFQKTRSEVSRIQKNMYQITAMPRMPGGKDYRVLHNTLSAKLHPSLPSPSTNRVTVNTVYFRDTTSSSSSVATSPGSSSSSPPTSVSSRGSVGSVGKPPIEKPVSPKIQKVTANPSHESSPSKYGKKDPMAALFMPKHRAHSQLPDGLISR